VEVLGREPARAFFDAHVRAPGPVAVADLDLVGLTVKRRASQGFDDKGGKPGKAEPGRTPGWLGAALPSGPKLVVGAVREGSPAWRAGLYAEDEVVAESGFRVDRGALWDRLCERGPGGTVRLSVFRRDELVEVAVTLGAMPEDTLWVEPVAEPTSAQRAAFEALCGGALPSTPPPTR
jgi:predicted metalloprotease with PDZ domain